MSADRQSWTQLRCTYRGNSIARGLQARISDPLWMLARQWQFGSFEGDDAASPARIEVVHSNVPVHTLLPPGAKPGDARAHPVGAGSLVEAMVEAEDPATLPSLPRMSGEAGMQLLRLIPADRRADARASLAADWPLVFPQPVDGPNMRALTALARGSFDGIAFYRALAADPALLSRHIAGPANETNRIARQWLGYCAERFDTHAAAGYWRQEALEYRFDLVAGDDDRADLRLAARDHTGDGLDWHAFDLKHDIVEAGAGGQRKEWLLPARVTYSGMPAERFWAFEDGEIYFGGVELEETSLAQMILAEFATVYGNDWFMAPLATGRGRLARVERLRVHDSFGEVTEIAPCAVIDGKKRGWRWFELSGDDSAERGLAPWLFLPQASSGGEISSPVERVVFTRDEAANLAWGIEELIEGGAGIAIDRRQHWHRIRDSILPAEPDPASEADGQASDPADRPWRYRLVTETPPHWVPFQPATADGRATGMLVRSRLSEWDLLGEAREAIAGPQGLVMARTAPMSVADEEILRGGVVVERNYQSARGPDGRLHLWASRRKLPGSGDRPSGRKTDAIEKGGRG